MSTDVALWLAIGAAFSRAVRPSLSLSSQTAAGTARMQEIAAAIPSRARYLNRQ